LIKGIFRHVLSGDWKNCSQQAENILIMWFIRGNYCFRSEDAAEAEGYREKLASVS
jgi:hypothetical protein